MKKNKGKISVKQLMIIFILTVYSPFARYLATTAAGEAKQAGWLTPLGTLFIFLLLLYCSGKLIKKYNGKSFSEILYDVTSKFYGKIIIIIYIVWTTYLLIWYVRYFSETMVSLVYPNIKVNIFTIVLLSLIAIIIRSGIVVIARMSEVIFLVVTILGLSLIILMIPNIEIKNITPISYLDIVPILKGSFRLISLISLPFLYFFSHEWSKSNKFFKEGFRAGLYLFGLSTLIILVSIGTVGHTLISRSSFSFWVAVKQINILRVLSGFESILISTWILTDFIIIIVFIYSAMNMFKSLFNLKDYKQFINIYIFIVYLLTWLIAESIWELDAFSEELGVYITNSLVIFPIFIFLIAKIRKKI